MKWIRSIYPLCATLVTILFLAGCNTKKNNTTENGEIYYTCSMHPKIRENKPGNCPICGMKLIKKEEDYDQDSGSVDTLLSYLAQPVTQMAVGAFSVVTPVEEEANDTIDAEGIISFDQRNIRHIAARVSGRIDKIYLQYSGQVIHAGQALAEIYSPQLVSSQLDLIQAIRDGDQVLANRLAEKLVNLGMHKKEIQKVILDKTPVIKFTIISPYEGIAVRDGEQSVNDRYPVALYLKEGMYVDAGQTIFSIQNPDSKWVVLYIFSNASAQVHTGDVVELFADADPDKTISAKINFIPPYRENEEQAMPARVYLNDTPVGWKIGTVVHGKIIDRRHDSALYVPLTAVDHLGKRNVVWVKDKKYRHIFHRRRVATGRTTNNSIEIISGILPGEQIVKNAGYMTGSESFIQ